MKPQTVEELENIVRDRIENEEDADNLIYLSLSIASELTDLGVDGVLIAQLVLMRMTELHSGNTTIH